MTTINLLYDMHLNEGRASSGSHISLVENAMDKLNAQNADWTVVGGDLRPSIGTNGTWGDWPDDDPFYVSDLDIAKDKLDNYLSGGELRIIRGNHDRPEKPFFERFPVGDYSVTDDRDEQVHGYWGTEVRNGIRYIYLDSRSAQGIHKQTQIDAIVTDPQISMLRRIRDKDTTTPTFVFIHNPLYPISGTGVPWGEGKSQFYELIYNRHIVRQLLEDLNTILVHCGHVYNSLTASTEVHNGIEYSILDHLGRGTSGNDTGWLEIDEINSTADLKRYNVSSDTTSTLTTVTW